MTISSATAKQLCTKSELSLFTQSLSRNVKSLDVKSLRNRIDRTRKLRDKYKQLAHRQDREARSKQRPRGQRASQGSAATRKKEQLFAESLARFEKRLADVEATSAAPAKEVVKSAKKRSTGKRTASTKSAAGRKSTAKKATKPKKSVVKKTTTKKKVKRKTAASKKGTATRSVHAKVATKSRTSRRSAESKRATPKAKKAKIKASGLVRRQKHRSAENRKRQARRDSTR